MRKMVVCGTGVSLFISACAATAVKPVAPPIPTPAFVNWSQSGVSDKRICVLPFADKTDTEGLADQVRESFSGQLSVKRFSDVELHEIDTRLAALRGSWRNLPAQQLGQALGCQALVYGEVTKASRFYLGIYAQLSLAGTIRVVDVTTGHTLVEESYTSTFRNGGVPFSPLAVLPQAVLNLRSMTDAQMVQAIDDLGRHLAEKVPDLPTTPAVQYVAAPVPSASVQAEPEEVTPPVPARTDQGRYQVQVAAFSTPGEAKQAVRLLRDKGFKPAIVKSNGPDRSRHQVVVGPFPSINEARQASVRIQKSLRFTPVVLRTTAR